MGIVLAYLPEEEGLLETGVFAPQVICDVCAERIEDIGLGTYVMDNRPEACPQAMRFAHKGQCHDELEALVSAAGGNPGWHELSRLPEALANNMNPDWPEKAYRISRN